MPLRVSWALGTEQFCGLIQWWDYDDSTRSCLRPVRIRAWHQIVKESLLIELAYIRIGQIACPSSLGPQQAGCEDSINPQVANSWARNSQDTQNLHSTDRKPGFSCSFLQVLSRGQTAPTIWACLHLSPQCQWHRTGQSDWEAVFSEVTPLGLSLGLQVVASALTQQQQYLESDWLFSTSQLTPGHHLQGPPQTGLPGLTCSTPKLASRAGTQQHQLLQCHAPVANAIPNWRSLITPVW